MAQQDAQNGASETVVAAVSFPALKPQLFVEAPKADNVVTFYKNVFGAEEISRTLNPKHKVDDEIPRVLSAKLKIDGSLFLVVDSVYDSATPVKTNGNCVVFALETEDVGSAITKAVKSGAGEGSLGKVTDPCSYVWKISTPLKKEAEVAA